MKPWALLLFLFFTQTTFSQSHKINFNAIDWRVTSIDAPTPDSLAKKLTLPYQTDIEKVRAIYRWITENIAYNVPVFNKYPHSTPMHYWPDDWADSAFASKSLEEIVAYNVLRKKAAVCNGYTKLFKTLCDYAGIRNEIITGYARTNTGRAGERFRTNHTWNAVMIDSTWQLLDVTWASGFITYSNQFVKQLDDYYFLTPPKDFIQDHYPEDIRWTLLSNPPILKEFEQTPFRPTAFVKYNIKAFKPAKGLIEASVGDTLQFEVAMAPFESDKKMAPEDGFDFTDSSLTKMCAFIQPSNIIANSRIIYNWVVPEAPVSLIHLLFNNDIILQYKLAIKKK